MPELYIKEIKHTLKLLEATQEDYDINISIMSESDIIDLYHKLNNEFYESYN